jgi:hypothetical protein
MWKAAEACKLQLLLLLPAVAAFEAVHPAYFGQSAAGSQTRQNKPLHNAFTYVILFHGLWLSLQVCCWPEVLQAV